MPRPKPDAPWFTMSLRLAPAQYERVKAFAERHGFTVAGAIRHMIEFHEEVPAEQVGEVMREIAARVEPPRLPKAPPGSRLKKR